MTNQTTFIIIQLLAITLGTSAFLSSSNTCNRVQRWGGKWSAQQQYYHHNSFAFRLHSVDKSLNAEEINSRLEKQIQKLREKDATSRLLNKEVSMLFVNMDVEINIRD